MQNNLLICSFSFISHSLFLTITSLLHNNIFIIAICIFHAVAHSVLYLILNFQDSDGFYTGQVREAFGLVPSNYLQKEEKKEGEMQRQQSTDGEANKLRKWYDHCQFGRSR